MPGPPHTEGFQPLQLEHAAAVNRCGGTVAGALTVLEGPPSENAVSDVLRGRAAD